ncbi:hypothetical protein [Saccharicrinis sp. FJH54]|uniref:hypothetical protein n=1 Tax=Saccharicrinis sp. FJH54 TaxID=3344665 RepID=UPI0035D4D691
MKFIKPVQVLFCLCLCIALNANAQKYMGKFFIGGSSDLNANIIRDVNSDETLKSVNMTPEAGWFAFENLVVGLGVPFEYQKEKNRYDLNKYISFLVVPYLKYIATGNNTVRPFFKAQFGFGASSYSEDNYRKQKYQQVFYGFSGGLDLFISKNFVLDTGIGYSFISRTVYQQDYFSSYFNLGPDLNVRKLSSLDLTVGIIYIL